MTVTQSAKKVATRVFASFVISTLTPGIVVNAETLTSHKAVFADADCATNVYRVVWRYAGVYDTTSESSYKILTKESGDRVTGPPYSANVPANGYHWTKVWVYSVPGWREGWMRGDAVTYIGCS